MKEMNMHNKWKYDYRHLRNKALNQIVMAIKDTCQSKIEDGRSAHKSI